MSVLNCVGEPEECPLCMEPFEMDDLNFFPCTCGYQICRFCWHRIRTDENGLCPACRKAYPENPANFKPLTQEELQHIKQEKRQKDLQRKQKVTENRKHLANVRVVQKNLVFVVGLSSRLADPEGPSASAYVTYQKAEDALRAIQAVNNIHVDGRVLKASLGTTKYCSHFMKNQQCPKTDCMYLHELGDESASFTKEEMQQGKHQDFEKKLQEQYLGPNCYMDKTNGISPSGSSVNINTSSDTTTTPSVSLISSSGLTGSSSSGGHHHHQNNNNKKNDNHTKETNGTNKISYDQLSSDAKEGWPALHVISNKENNSKRTRSKSERHGGSARQTPTEEHNKRNNREREKKQTSTKENVSSFNKEVNMEEEMASSAPPTSSSSSQSLSTTPCSTQDSCASSASATPPPQSLESVSVPHTPPHTASSPMPVVDASGHRTERENTSSPIGTTPSSLSSCSELSSSLPPSQQIPSLSSSSVPNSMPPSSLFSDNTNSFFSQQTLTLSEGIAMYDQAGEEMLQKAVETERLLLSEEPQTSFPNSLTNGDHHHHHHIPSDWRTGAITGGDHMFLTGTDTCSNNAWNAIFEFDNSSDIKNEAVIEHRVDDELGFDPFEETNKALAEDILLERKQQQMEKHLQLRQQQQQLLQQKLQQQHQQQQQQHHHHQQQQMQLHGGIKNYLDSYTCSTAKDLSQTRLPPPGFNGMSLAGFPSAVHQTQQTQHISKVMPPFIGNLGTSHISGLGSASNSPTPQLNGLIGSNRLGVPPGLANNVGGGGSLLNGVHSGLLGNLNSSIPSQHHITAASLMTMENPVGVSQAPPGLGISQKPIDPFVFKDLENGINSIRNMFPPSLNSVTTMNTVNTLNSLAAATNNPQGGSLASQNNPLSNFITLAQQQQQHSLQQQQQQHQFSSQQNLMNHLGSNMLSSSPKGWASGTTDLTAIDPAIVSSGQLTDSRSDSPPQWLKALDQTHGDSNLGGGSWNNILPFNLIGALPGSIGGMHSHLGPQAAAAAAAAAAAQQQQQQQQQQQTSSRRSTMWPPTSPPPGFNTLSPLHHAKQRESHKIESNNY